MNIDVGKRFIKNTVETKASNQNLNGNYACASKVKPNSTIC